MPTASFASIPAGDGEERVRGDGEGRRAGRGAGWTWPGQDGPPPVLVPLPCGLPRAGTGPRSAAGLSEADGPARSAWGVGRHVADSA